MLALRTGWTSDVLADMPAGFRAACHWALHAEAIVGTEGLPSDDIPQGSSPDVLRAALERRQVVADLRTLLYPEGDD